MNKLQKAFWLAKKNFIRGVFANISSVFLLAISNLVLFFFFLLKSNALKIETPETMIATIFTVIVLFVVFISLIAIHSLNIKLRYHEIALLKGIGAERSFIKMMLFSEIGFLFIVSIAIAALFIISLFAFFGQAVFSYIKPFAEGEILVPMIVAALASILINLFLTFISVVLPISLVSSIEPYFAIRKRE